MERRCLPPSLSDDDVEGVSTLDLVTVVGESLPKVVPSVILAKREELTTMLMAAIQVRKEGSRQDRALRMFLTRIDPSLLFGARPPSEPAVQPGKASGLGPEVLHPQGLPRDGGDGGAGQD